MFMTATLGDERFRADNSVHHPGLMEGETTTVLMPAKEKLKTFRASIKNNEWRRKYKVIAETMLILPCGADQGCCDANVREQTLIWLFSRCECELNKLLKAVGVQRVSWSQDRGTI